jgi:hypothetical protein
MKGAIWVAIIFAMSLANGIYATYWPKVHDIFDTVFFQNQGYVGVVDPIKVWTS